MPFVLLATCADPPASAADDAPLTAALDELGVRAEWASWDDPAAGVSRADLVVLRSPWDYTQRREEFLSWCDSLPAVANTGWPRAVASWIAVTPMPELPPCTSRVSPGARRARSNTLLQTVK